MNLRDRSLSQRLPTPLQFLKQRGWFRKVDRGLLDVADIEVGSNRKRNMRKAYCHRCVETMETVSDSERKFVSPGRAVSHYCWKSSVRTKSAENRNHAIMMKPGYTGIAERRINLLDWHELDLEFLIRKSKIAGGLRPKGCHLGLVPPRVWDIKIHLHMRARKSHAPSTAQAQERVACGRFTRASCQGSETRLALCTPFPNVNNPSFGFGRALCSFSKTARTSSRARLAKTSVWINRSQSVRGL